MILVIVGALNWGLVGVTNFFGQRFDLVEYFTIEMLNLPVLTDIVYILVGLSAIIAVVMMKGR